LIHFYKREMYRTKHLLKPLDKDLRIWRQKRNFGQETQVWNERRVVGYSCDQLFNVVSRIDKYQEFIPYCKKSVVTLRKDSNLSANLVIRFQPFFNISYTSHVTFIKPYLVTAVCKDMTLFEHLHTVWKFTPEENNSNHTSVDFAVSFKFQNSYHSYVAGLFIDDVVKRNMDAFLDRTQAVYGPPGNVQKNSQTIKQSKSSS